MLNASKLENGNGDNGEVSKKSPVGKKVSFLGGAEHDGEASPEPVSDTYIYQGDKEKKGVFSSLKRNKNK